MSVFLPKLAEYMAVLTPLTTKEVDKVFPEWGAEQQEAFEKIKEVVLSRKCLTVIDHEEPGEREIFVTCDASERGTGAMLSFGETWKTARPVAFDSAQFSSCQKNYPVHEKELLAIIRALTRWRYDLLGTRFKVYTDHRTLEHFMTQKDLSHRQARWQEFLAQYDFQIIYVQGQENSVADALSRVEPEMPSLVATPVFSIAADLQLLNEIKDGYEKDDWCIKLRENMASSPEARQTDGLLYWKERLIIPRHGTIRESLFRLAHDTLGHFGMDKTYGALRESFYWPNMRRDLELAYVPSCNACQCNKSSTRKPAGPLHPLPIPDV